MNKLKDAKKLTFIFPFFRNLLIFSIAFIGFHYSLSAQLTIEKILDYQSLANVKVKLNQTYTKKGSILFPYRETNVSGLIVLQDILEGYNPEEAIINTSIRLSQLFSKYNIDNDVDRTFFANVAHALWIEMNVYKEILVTATGVIGGVGGVVDLNSSGGVLGIKKLGVSWSLKDFTREQIDEYLLGSVVKPFPYDKRPIARACYHFKYYGIAKDVLLRMAPFHKKVSTDHTTAIARFLEYGSDNFIYWNTFKIYKKINIAGDQWPYNVPIGFEDADFSDTYHHRIIYEGVNQIPIYLSRAVNIPSKQIHKLTEGIHKFADPDEKYESGQHGWYEFIHFPTISRWAYKHALIGVTKDKGHGFIQGFGQLGESILWDKIPTSGKKLREKATLGIREAKIDLFRIHRARVNDGNLLTIPPLSARKIKCGESGDSPCGSFTSKGMVNGVTITGWDYIKARFGHLQVEHDPHKNTWWIPEQQFSPLDRIVGYWPFDTPWFERDLSLNHLDFIANDLDYVQLNVQDCVRGGCLTIENKANLKIQKKSVLARTNLELSISLWLKKKAGKGGVLFERVRTNDNSLLYRLNILDDGKVEFNYRKKDALQPLTTYVSNKKIPDDTWVHLVITFDGSESSGEIASFFNGKQDKVMPVKGMIQMGTVINDDQGGHHYYRVIEKPFQAENYIGGGFSGTIDELLLHSSALTYDQVKNLYQSF